MRYVLILFLSVFLFAKNILILNSYSVDLEWTQNELKGILTSLKDDENKKFIEFMDTKIFRPTPERMKDYYEYLSKKFKNIKIDIIITTDDNALNFVRKYKNAPLFKSAKVFFCGVNNLGLAKTLDKKTYTGVFEQNEPLKNLEFAEKIKKNLKTIYLINDSSVSGLLVTKEFMDKFKDIKKYHFKIISAKDIKTVAHQLKNYDKNSVAMLISPTSYYLNSKHIDYKKASQLLSTVYKNPMIVHADLLVDIPRTNIVGGKVTDGFSQGVEAGKKVNMFLKGKSVQNIPYSFGGVNKMYLNVKNLEKFGIDAYSLGYKNAVYVNRGDDFWKKYGIYIYALIALLIVVFIIVAVLLHKNRKLKEKNINIKSTNEQLEQRVQQIVKEMYKKEQMLLHQTRLAAMGEMIGAIAHQWRQPLNTLAINIQLLPEFLEEVNYDEEKIEEFIDKNMKTIFFMSTTIDDFRNFFKDNNEKEEFSIKHVLDETLKLVGAQLKNNDISVKIEGDDFSVYGSKTQFQQVLLNLISNAKDAIKSSGVVYGEITVRLDAENKTIKIEDNGGGIDRKNLYKIFEPYFTTKDSKSSGIGLYMSKTIIEKYFNGKLEASNGKKGAIFTIKLK